MKNQKLISEYRLLDRDCALYSDKLRSSRSFETTLLVPDISERDKLAGELEALKARALSIEKPDDVFSLIQSHFIDFLDEKKLEMENLFKRPARHISTFFGTFYSLVRKDSRSDEEKAQILIARYSQADNVWRGIKTWLEDVSILNLQEFISNCKLFIDTMVVEIPRVSAYFNHFNEARINEIIDSIKTLSAKMTEWIQYTEAIAAKKGILAPQETTDSDVIKFEESFYRALLGDVVGVNLDEILTWHEEEINKTREDVFEIAGKLKIPDPFPKTMSDVNDILLKYAGPCDTPEEMYERANGYIKRAQAAAREYVWLPDDETCEVTKVPENLKSSYPWGGYGGGCPLRRPLKGEMFLNNYNYKAITDGWIKMNTVHEAYPGHHVQFVRATLDPIPETIKIGAKSVPLSEGTSLRSERAFEFIFSADPFYKLFVAYRRHHTSVRIKADLMLRYFGNTIGEVTKLYMDELGFDRTTARGQVKAQEGQQGYFTSYYYGLKNLSDWEEKYGYDKKTYTELLFAAGRLSLINFEKFLKLSKEDKERYLKDFPSLLQFK